MSNYSKLIGSVVGAAIGVAVSKWGLPPEFASPEVVGGITAILSALCVYFAPANKKQ